MIFIKSDNFKCLRIAHIIFIIVSNFIKPICFIIVVKELKKFEWKVFSNKLYSKFKEEQRSLKI